MWNRARLRSRGGRNWHGILLEVMLPDTLQPSVGEGERSMSPGHRRAVHAVAAWLLSVASPAGPAAGQIDLTNSTGEILAGQSGNLSSTTIVSQGKVFLDEPTTTATTRVGFNINA